jgi:hypothetical protein
MSGGGGVSRRKRIYAIGISLAVLAAAALAGGYLYLIWLQRVVEQITD